MSKDERAPPDLEIVRQFINISDLEHPDRETFADPLSASRWLRAQRLISKRKSITARELLVLRSLREALRAETLAHNGEGDSASSWSALSHFTKEAKLLVQIDPHPGQIKLSPAAASSANTVVARLLAIMYDAIRRNQWQRLKACRKQSCLWAFYDNSKNGSGIWCDMATCGNRVKAQRRRKRSL